MGSKRKKEHVVNDQDEENGVKDLDEVQRKQSVTRDAHFHPWNETQKERRQQLQNRSKLLGEASYRWNQCL